MHEPYIACMAYKTDAYIACIAHIACKTDDYIAFIACKTDAYIVYINCKADYFQFFWCLHCLHEVPSNLQLHHQQQLHY